MSITYSEPVSPRFTSSHGGSRGSKGIPTPEHIFSKHKDELLKFHKAQSYIMLGVSASGRSKTPKR